MTNLGATFKQARESRGISLDQIANETRISTRFLAAIENEEFHLLPGGVFNRGFVRAYAEKIGIDPDQAVAEYQRIAEVRQPEILSSPTPTAARKGRGLYPVALGTLFLLIVIFYVATREGGHTAQTASAPAKPSAENVQAAAPVIPPPDSVTRPAAAPETTATAPTVEPPPQAPPIPQAPVQTALKLEMEATEKTWVKVTADGTTVDPGEVLEAGTTRKFTAQNTIHISVGNAAGVNLKLNDKPMKPLGKSGQVREVTITPDTAKDFTG
jgi:cytoskeletal protein RodZ